MGLIPGIANRLKGRYGVWCGSSDLLIWGWQALTRRFNTPDLPGILGNGTVTGKLARGGYVPDHHPCPLSWVLVQLTDFVLAFNVFLIICKDFKPVMVHEHVDDVLEQVRLFRGEEATA